VKTALILPSLPLCMNGTLYATGCVRFFCGILYKSGGHNPDWCCGSHMTECCKPFFLGIITTNKGHWNRIRSFMLLSSKQLNKGSLPLRLTIYTFLYFLPRLNSLLDIIVSMSVLVGYSITTASFVLYVVKEHQTKAKQLQHISGIGMTSYWVTNFVYDLVNNSNS